ncbi:hypothetical protein EWM64_g9569 [Hericium alpestre]|uniref:Essential protein Yae1 N-terminal domain-containing protein n=1 Tax=Hericium alpestre TaxID=135208 RepID=A0A4Y9ZKL7_9AGAM|nr:hypothetical protein EWM64_g9569 [Hericium alpestre]
MGKKQTAARRAAAPAAVATATCPAPSPITPAVLDDLAVTATALDFVREPTPVPTQPSHDASSCLAHRTSTSASYVPTPATHGVSIPRSSIMHSHTTGIESGEPHDAIRRNTCNPRHQDMHPTSHTTYLHPATHHYLQTRNGNTVHAYAIAGELETYQGVHPKNEAHADDEHTQYIPRGTIPVQHAPCPTSHASCTHVVNPHNMPKPPTYTAQPHATTNGRENEVGARERAYTAQMPNGPAQAPFLTPAGLTATLAALMACIPVHGPPNVFFACHAPILVHTDPRIAVSHKLTKDATDSKPHADPQRPTARRATSIDEIDEDLLACIHGASEERGWQGGWDAGEVHGRAEGYREGCEVAKCEVSTTSRVPDTVDPAAHSDSTHSVPRPSPIKQSPAPGFELGLSLTTPADELCEAHDANANSVSTSNDVRPQWATSLFELDPNLFHKILDQGKHKGRKAGRIEGREEGYKEGHEEGYREGHKDGLKEGLVHAAEH